MSTSQATVGVLEVGGSHVAATRVTIGGAFDGGDDRPGPPVPDPPRIVRLDGQWSGARIVRTLARAMRDVEAAARASDDAVPTRWAVAMPGPFDYEQGVARHVGVGKFDRLRDVDLRTALALAIEMAPQRIAFVNDADAFAVGEWLARRGAGSPSRLLGLTLGTGVGSGWVVDGRAVHAGPGVPPDGEVHRLLIDSAPLEDRVSARALSRQYREWTGLDADPASIAAQARAGSSAARDVLEDAMRALGQALANPVREFGAHAIVVGGGIAQSWDLIGAPLHSGLHTAGRSPVALSATASPHSALIGAAWATQ